MGAEVTLDDFKDAIVKSVKMNFERNNYSIPPTCLLFSKECEFVSIALPILIFTHKHKCIEFAKLIQKSFAPKYIAFAFEAEAIEITRQEFFETNDLNELINDKKTSGIVAINVFEVNGLNLLLRWKIMKLGEGILPYLDFMTEEEVEEDDNSSVTFFKYFH